MLELRLFNVNLPQRHPFTIAHGTTLVQHNLIVELRAGGHSGYGEAAPSQAYPEITPANIRAALEVASEQIERETLDDPAALWDRLVPVLGHDRFALCGAGRSRPRPVGQAARAPVWTLWGLCSTGCR